MEQKTRIPTAAMTAAIVVLVLASGWLTSELLGARGELEGARTSSETAIGKLTSAEEEAASLRQQVVRLSMELDQQKALSDGRVSPRDARDLELELAAAKEMIEGLQGQVEATEEEPAEDSAAAEEAPAEQEAPPPEREPGRGRERSPEEEARRQQERQQFMDRARGALRERVDSYLDRAETAGADEAGVAREIADRLGQIDALMVSSAEAEDWEQRRENFGAMREHWSALGPLMEQDRDVRLRALAGQIGYEDKETTQQFVEYIDEIYEETSFNPRDIFGGGGPGRGRGRR